MESRPVSLSSPLTISPGLRVNRLDTPSIFKMGSVMWPQADGGTERNVPRFQYWVGASRRSHSPADSARLRRRKQRVLMNTWKRQEDLTKQIRKMQKMRDGLDNKEIQLLVV